MNYLALALCFISGLVCATYLAATGHWIWAIVILVTGSAVSIKDDLKP